MAPEGAAVAEGEGQREGRTDGDTSFPSHSGYPRVAMVGPRVHPPWWIFLRCNVVVVMGSVAGRTAMVVVVVVVVDRGRGRGGTATRWRGVRLDFGIDGTRETRYRLDLVELWW